MKGAGALDPGGTSRPAPAHIESVLARQARRLGLSRGLGALSRALPWALLAFLPLVVARSLGLLQPVVLPAAVVASVLLLALFAVTVWRRIPDPGRMALLLDLKLGAREVISAAAEAGPRASHPLARAARRRAAETLASAEVRGSFPLTRARDWRPVLLAAAALALAPLVPRLPGLAPAVVPHDARVQEAGEEMAQELEALQGRLTETDRPASREALEEMLQLADSLRQGEARSPEQALTALDEMDRQLGRLQDQAERPARATGFERLASEMGQNALSAELASALESGERAALRRALQAMADALSADQASQKALARQLDDLADRLSRMATMLRALGEQELAASFKELAQALREGDLEKARELLGSEKLARQIEAIAPEVKKACEGGAQSELARDLRELLNEARWRVGGLQPQKLGKPCKACGKKGCMLHESGPRPGTGSTNEEAPGYRAGDPFMRHRQSDETSGSTGDYEDLHDSRRVDPDTWEEIQASGEMGAEGEILSETGLSLGLPGEATLPLLPLDAPAAGAPERAADLEKVPPGYRDLVQRYFDRRPDP